MRIWPGSSPWSLSVANGLEDLDAASEHERCDKRKDQTHRGYICGRLDALHTIITTAREISGFSLSAAIGGQIGSAPAGVAVAEAGHEIFHV